jgi:EmrB/QacA subfamily drug resistance transporter
MSQGMDTIRLQSREYRLRWFALIGASLAVFMAALDSNVVSVALPIMAGAFHVTSSIRWVVLSYILPSTALLGAFGALSDVIGRKKVTLIGVTVFVAGSILCGTAQSLEQMIIYRVLQGIGASCIGSAIMAIATVSFGPEERGKAMSVVSLIVPLGGVVGPGLGGLLIGSLGWPSIFYINVPFGIIAFALIFRLLPRDTASQRKAFDVGGAVLFTGALLALIIGLSPTGGRLTDVDFILLAACVAAIAGLVIVERRAQSPLVPPSLMARSTFTVPVLGLMTMGIVAAGMGFVLPFFLEGSLGMKPAEAGLTLLFLPLAMALASQVGGRLSDRFHPRVPAAVGATLILVGIGLISPLNPHWTSFAIGWRLALTGLGFGLFTPANGVATMSAAPRDHVGVAGALTNTARFLGFSLGPTLAAVLWSPGLIGAANLAAMRTVLIVLGGVEVLTIASVAGYTATHNGRTARAGLESQSPAA